MLQNNKQKKVSFTERSIDYHTLFQDSYEHNNTTEKIHHSSRALRETMSFSQKFIHSL